MPGYESTPTVKDAHSPAGQPFHAPRSFADMPDCPICRYGTPTKRKDRWVRIDCRCDVKDAPAWMQAQIIADLASYHPQIKHP
jgi:hypothetical protein